MENKNISQKTTVITLAVLLILAIIFWFYSKQSLENKNIQTNSIKTIQAGTPVSDIEIGSNIDAAIQADSELEIKNIDNEFN